MKFRHDSRAQLEQVSAHGLQLLEVPVVEADVGLEYRMHLRLEFATLDAVVNGFRALFERESEQ